MVADQLVIRPAKRRKEITDILTWMQGFSVYTLVLTSYWPARIADLLKYQLLIMRTAQQFAGSTWLSYDRAFRRQAAAYCLTDWSVMNAELYYFHVSHEKLVATLQLLRDWAGKKWCKRKELESLIGSLHHVTKVVPPGRTFLRRMIDLLCAFRSPSRPIRLNREFRRDLAWWLDFLQSWNGVSFFRMPSVCSFPDLFVASDSSGAIGFSDLAERVVSGNLASSGTVY